MGSGTSPMGKGGGAAKAAPAVQTAEQGASNGTQEQSARNTGNTNATVTAPKDLTGVMSTMKVATYTRENGLQRVSNSELASLPIGTKVVVSSPILNSRSGASRRDPDGVHFATGTFAGFQTSAFHRPIVQLTGGKRVAVETDMPYETIYRTG